MFVAFNELWERLEKHMVGESAALSSVFSQVRGSAQV
jgi:hypothetical protein